MTPLFTKTDYDRLPEGFPAQLVDGELLRDPSPTYGHQNVQMRLLRLLMPLVEPGLLVAGPADVLVDEHNVYQPDIVVLHTAPPREDHYVGTPLLAIEVLSAGTSNRDRDLKTPRLLALGVEEVWLVDPVAGTVECRTRSGATLAAGGDVVSSDAVPGFSVRPDDLFG